MNKKYVIAIIGLMGCMSICALPIIGLPEDEAKKKTVGAVRPQHGWFDKKKGDARQIKAWCKLFLKNKGEAVMHENWGEGLSSDATYSKWQLGRFLVGRREFGIMESCYTWQKTKLLFTIDGIMRTQEYRTKMKRLSRQHKRLKTHLEKCSEKKQYYVPSVDESSDSSWSASDMM